VLPGQGSCRAVAMMIDDTCAGVGRVLAVYCAIISAASPATCGVAIEVPCTWTVSRFQDANMG